MIVTGILLEVSAAVLGTMSKQLIAYSEHMHKRWMFVIGASINICVGPLIDASAYAFAPQVVVAPFACLDVILNTLTAPYTLSWQKERLTRVHIAATCLVALGALLTSVFGSVHDTQLSILELEAQLTKPGSLGYYFAEGALLLTMVFSLRARALSGAARGICLGVTAGVLMGNVFCMKGFIGIVRQTLEQGKLEAWLRPTPYLLFLGAGAGAILGHMFMRKGLGEYKGIFMVTIFEGAHIVAACLSGCVVMEEMAHAPWWQYVLYWVAVGVIVVGMLLINTSAAEAKLSRSFHLAQSFEAVGEHCPEEVCSPSSCAPPLGGPAFFRHSNAPTAAAAAATAAAREDGAWHQATQKDYADDECNNAHPRHNDVGQEDTDQILSMEVNLRRSIDDLQAPGKLCGRPRPVRTFEV